jgi:hypothetical protein
MSKTYSIKCTKCSAPLTLLGGGRVETVTCSYCKSVLDLNDEYRVLSNFKEYKEKNKLPFEIGMKGVVNSIEYTIIGRITYQESEPPFEEWSDLLLFSPLYGYAWLTYEAGHISYSRRNRTFPNLSWNSISQQSTIKVDDKIFNPFSSYSAKVIYVEGELTWVAKKDDETQFIDLIAPPWGMSIEKSKDEVEYYTTEYLNAEDIYESFGVKKEQQILNSDFHTLKPFKKPWLEALSKISLWVMIISIIVMIALSIDGKGEVISTFKVENNKNINQNFTLKDNTYLTDIQLSASTNKSLKNFNIKIEKEGKLLFSLNGTTAYRFEGNSKNNSKAFSKWDSRAKKVSIYLHLKTVGEYQFIASAIDKSISSSINVTIKEREVRVNYILQFFLVTLLLFGIYKIVYWRYKRKLQEEQTIFNREETISSSIYEAIINHLPQIAFFIFIIYMIIYSD